VNESEALRWVTWQWQRLSGKDEISGVGGMSPLSLKLEHILLSGDNK